MNQREIEQLVREAVRDADLHSAEIPSIDLYVDQVTSLVSDKIQEGSLHFQDRVLTKTMINNYSKDGLIQPIKGKKYSHAHILQMLLVYSLKNTLSIGEIKRMLQSLYAMPEFGAGALTESYDRFLEIKEKERAHMWDFVASFAADHGLDPEQDGDFFVLLLGLASMSSYLRDTVQVLLEARYPDLSAEREREERERRAQAKREKEEKKASSKSKKESAQEQTPAENSVDGGVI